MSQPMHWKQRHHFEVCQSLTEHGEMDRTGRIRRWFGKETWARLNALGHTSLDVEHCECRLRVPATGHTEER